ncbi:hypothetical protein OF83DRAFT_557224 [Amylostereum chailletii]|nr:hypothetical protein OF83DRAFT_557224 [Amylostereum chailletii]
MTSAPTQPIEIPPYQVQPLLDTVIELYGYNSADGVPLVDVRCAQALGSEIYVGCSNGELLRFALQVNDPDQPESYSLLSRQTLPAPKPIDEIILVPSISRALVLCDRQVHFYVLPSLDVVPIKPVRNVQTFAVDHQHIIRPAPPFSDPPIPVEPVELCIVKRSSIALCSLREQLSYQKEIPLPNGAFVARRSGKYLCVANREQYAMVNLQRATITALLPISQAPPGGPLIRPVITVISEREFLVLSWNGASTMGLFLTGDADPVRGTIEWPSHPLSVCLDYPNITALLPNQTIEVHNVETQAIVQVVPAPPLPPPTAEPGPELLAGERRALILSADGFLVPSKQQSEKLRLTKVKLLGRKKDPGGRKDGEETLVSPVDMKAVDDRLREAVDVEDGRTDEGGLTGNDGLDASNGDPVGILLDTGENDQANGPSSEPPAAVADLDITIEDTPRQPSDHEDAETSIVGLDADASIPDSEPFVYPEEPESVQEGAGDASEDVDEGFVYSAEVKNEQGDEEEGFSYPAAEGGDGEDEQFVYTEEGDAGGVDVPSPSAVL